MSAPVSLNFESLHTFLTFFSDSKSGLMKRNEPVMEFDYQAQSLSALSDNHSNRLDLDKKL